VSIPVITLHMPKKHAGRLGAVVALRDLTGGGSLSREIKLLGFSWRKVNGSTASGGPGHVVPGVWVVPRSRWESDDLLRKAVELLMARNNGVALREVAALQAELVAMKLGAPAFCGEGDREQVTGNRGQACG